MPREVEGREGVRIECGCLLAKEDDREGGVPILPPVRLRVGVPTAIALPNFHGLFERGPS